MLFSVCSTNVPDVMMDARQMEQVTIVIASSAFLLRKRHWGTANMLEYIEKGELTVGS